MDHLYEKLKEFKDTDIYPMHMPGHKRNMPLEKEFDHYRMDITEIEDFDNLHDPSGIIAKSQKEAAELFGSEDCYYLVNGSTCGILTALSCCVKKGGTVLLARNSHKAAYHGVFLRDLKTQFLYPDWIEEYGVPGEIKAEDVEEKLKEFPEIEAVFITSPTFDGMISDIRKIADIVHRYNAYLIVDEAHGAHFGFHTGKQWYNTPESAVKLGADIIIQSIHKTLPSLTQTALFHINGKEELKERARFFLSIYETSSPSYVFLSSIDYCIKLLKKHGKDLFDNYENHLISFYDKCKQFQNLELCSSKGTMKGLFLKDPGKLLVRGKKNDLDGYRAYEKLYHQYKIQMEMAGPDYVLGMTSILDRKEGFQRLFEALSDMDTHYFDYQLDSKQDQKALSETGKVYLHRASAKYTLSEADLKKTEFKEYKECVGHIAADEILIYPPGIPFLLPGEVIDEKMIEIITVALKYRLPIKGLTKQDDYILGLHVIA